MFIENVESNIYKMLLYKFEQVRTYTLMFSLKPRIATLLKYQNKLPATAKQPTNTTKLLYSFDVPSLIIDAAIGIPNKFANDNTALRIPYLVPISLTGVI